MLRRPPAQAPAAPAAALSDDGMDKSNPCGSNLGPGASAAAGKGQQPRSNSAGPAGGDSKPKGDGKNANGSRQRYNRKRETSYPKNESFSSQPRRSTSQKSKAFNKMPPQRGGHGSGCKPFSASSNCGRREEVAEAQRAEFSPAQFSGPKKISLNHLLNFTFEPRGHASHYDGNSRGSWGRRNKWENKPFNKELFLQANCQFVVCDDQDYTIHFTDPDTLVNWDFVEQVRICSHEVPSCPICLYPPTAAKITRCGHIFCWPCILHYLSLSEKTWSKCPICYGSIHKKDLKSVVALETRQYAVGDTITMQLMQREKGALMALPKSKVMLNVEQPIHLGDKQHSQYSKLLLASKAQVLQEVIAEEKVALLQQYEEDKHTPEACFIEAAIQELKDREDSLVPDRNRDDDVAETTAAVEELGLMDSSDKEATVAQERKCVLEYRSAFDEEVLEPPPEDSASALLPTSVTKEEAVVEDTEDSVDMAGPNGLGEAGLPEAACEESQPPSAFSNGRPSNSPCYYFYQAEDGQCLYLHPVNVRCLVHEYGSLEKSPETITATVVEISGHSMTEDVRQRHRYLCHLPLTCEFSICELALKPPVISRGTLQMFADDIEKRKRLRQKKARDEQRRERRIELEENKKQGRYPEVRIALENLQQFPAFSSYLEEPCGTENQNSALQSLQSRSPVSQPESLTSLSPTTSIGSPSLFVGSPSLCIGSLEEESALPSFAQMLRAGKAKPETWPKTIPKKKEENTSLAPPAPGDSDGESDNSDRIPVPSFQNSFSQAIEAAFLKLDKPPNASHFLEEKKGKKKKQKQTLLFSTSVVHTK